MQSRREGEMSIVRRTRANRAESAAAASP
jgi:hypothetical protein